MTESVFARRKRIADLRLAICHSCQYFKQKTTRCRACGCIMSFKALLPEADCPFKQWDLINTEDTKKENTDGIK